MITSTPSEPADSNYLTFCTDFTEMITRQKKSARNAVHLSPKKSAATDRPVKPGIPELLAWFASNNIPCCVASSTKHDIVVEYLRLAKLDKYFAYVIGGNQVQRSKPNPDIFLAACQRTDIKPEHALVLEDSENGILAASNANIPVVCIPDLKVPSEEIAKKTAAIVPDATAVISLFG